MLDFPTWRKAFLWGIAVIGMLFYDEPLIALTFVGAVIISAANYLNIRAEQRGGGAA